LVQLQETVPFADTGSPEWSREADAQDKLGEGRRRDPGNDGVHSLNALTDRLPQAPGDWLRKGHLFSPQRTVVNAPASTNPPMLAARLNDGLSENPAAAAAPRESPEMRRVRKIAPPGGSRRTSTSRAGRVNRPSSGPATSIGHTEPSLRFAAKTLTAGKREWM